MVLIRLIIFHGEENIKAHFLICWKKNTPNLKKIPNNYFIDNSFIIVQRAYWAYLRIFNANFLS